jgi:tRNA dimethylallyltransferase
MAVTSAGCGRRFAVLLMGPTGAGKSDLALRMALEMPVEIVSVDSALVYRGMDIGTAKPDLETRRQVPHHLIDIRDPVETYSAGEFVLAAREAMEGVWQRGRQPLLVGGTMLYFHALTAGIAELPERSPEVRAQIDAHAASVGWPAVHRELCLVDPEAASRIHANDAQRIQRALEVYRLTGEKMSTLQKLRHSVLSGAEIVEFAVLPSDRSVLHSRIETRFAAMLAAGFVEEVRQLHQRKDLSAEHPSMRAVGYRQIWQHLSGQCGLQEARERAIAATRQLAKRQLTWLRARPDAIRVDPMLPAALPRMMSALSEAGFTR